MEATVDNFDLERHAVVEAAAGTGKTFTLEQLVRRLLLARKASLDQILLVLLIIELLYTVQVSFREHGLLAEPFLVVALIAVIRRVLVITAEIAKLPESSDNVFRHAMWELGVMTAMILVLVGSLIMLQKYGKRHARE